MAIQKYVSQYTEFIYITVYQNPWNCKNILVFLYKYILAETINALGDLVLHVCRVTGVSTKATPHFCIEWMIVTRNCVCGC